MVKLPALTHFDREMAAEVNPSLFLAVAAAVAADDKNKSMNK